MRNLQKRFSRLYGDRAERCMHRLSMLLGRYDLYPEFSYGESRWSEKDVILITYGDMVLDRDETPLKALNGFLNRRLPEKTINTIHLLPFFPYSSDDGFSVIDYRTVDPKLGTWEDIAEINKNYRLMFDLVLNHVSKHSEWFSDYTAGLSPYREYFIESSPDVDLSAVVRPRALPLLTPTHTRDGMKHLWTTFSDDQIDLNFKNPDVLFEFLDILMLYLHYGVKVIRLDAIAYLWKDIGTSCIHLPETHEAVKIFRDVLDMIAPDAVLITETNVPHKENISYFGDGDEAHMVYQFSLPPLLLHALVNDSSKYLTEWASNLAPPPADCTFFNFTSSHDGIGLRPLEGIVPADEFDKMIEAIKARGGLISYKQNSDGSKSPYEANITYFDAMGNGSKNDALHIERFMCSQITALSLKGIPGIYFHNLFATPNDEMGVQVKGHNRAINRKKYQRGQLESLLKDKTQTAAKVFQQYKELLNVRRKTPAFHPEADQQVLKLSDDIFAVKRTPIKAGFPVFALCNFTPREQDVQAADLDEDFSSRAKCRDLITGKDQIFEKGALTFQPYQCMWIVAPDA